MGKKIQQLENFQYMKGKKKHYINSKILIIFLYLDGEIYAY